jgi:hypothetical protein
MRRGVAYKQNELERVDNVGQVHFSKLMSLAQLRPDFDWVQVQAKSTEKICHNKPLPIRVMVCFWFFDFDFDQIGQAGVHVL